MSTKGNRVLALIFQKKLILLFPVLQDSFSPTILMGKKMLKQYYHLDTLMRDSFRTLCHASIYDIIPSTIPIGLSERIMPRGSRETKNSIGRFHRAMMTHRMFSEVMGCKEEAVRTHQCSRMEGEGWRGVETRSEEEGRARSQGARSPGARRRCSLLIPTPQITACYILIYANQRSLSLAYVGLEKIPKWPG